MPRVSGLASRLRLRVSCLASISRDAMHRVSGLASQASRLRHRVSGIASQASRLRPRVSCLASISRDAMLRVSGIETRGIASLHSGIKIEIQIDSKKSVLNQVNLLIKRSILEI